jgi:hypothetical protein
VRPFRGSGRRRRVGDGQSEPAGRRARGDDHHVRRQDGAVVEDDLGGPLPGGDVGDQALSHRHAAGGEVGDQAGGEQVDVEVALVGEVEGLAEIVGPPDRRLQVHQILPADGFGGVALGPQPGEPSGGEVRTLARRPVDGGEEAAGAVEPVAAEFVLQPVVLGHAGDVEPVVGVRRFVVRVDPREGAVAGPGQRTGGVQQGDVRTPHREFPRRAQAEDTRPDHADPCLSLCFRRHVPNLLFPGATTVTCMVVPWSGGTLGP